jgi:cysteine desulfurase/selenocysteine lyase
VVRSIPALRVLGDLDGSDRIPLFTFTLGAATPSALAAELDKRRIAVRAGDMAAGPLLARFGLSEAVRASAWIYTTVEDIDALAAAMTQLA